MTEARHLVLRISVKILTPLIVLFALYVQTHGEYGPGGGFQAGVLLASAVVAYGLVFGPAAATRLAPPVAAGVLAALGIVLYAATGAISPFIGGSFLDHDGIAEALQIQPTTGQHIGIVLVEWGVFFTVAGSMIAIFYAFMASPADEQTEDFDSDESEEAH
ncbi:MAG: Na(+)/H(+) antiporter subunit B [Caulobacterales bacterium]